MREHNGLGLATPQVGLNARLWSAVHVLPLSQVACAANFVGSGDCDDVNDWLALLAGAGKKFNITVEYHTTRAYYPGFPRHHYTVAALAIHVATDKLAIGVSLRA